MTIFSALKFVGMTLALWAVLVHPEGVLAQSDFPDEMVVAKWKAYEAFSQRLQGSAETTSAGAISGKSHTRRYDFRQNKDSVLIAAIFDTTKTKEEISIANLHYYAQIVRETGSPESAVLKDLQADPRSPLPSSSYSLYGAMFLETSPHFCYRDNKLSDLFKNPMMQVKKIDNVPSDGKHFTRVSYTYISALPGNVKRQLKCEGAMFLDPERTWSIHHIKETQELQTGGVREYVLECDISYEIDNDSVAGPLIRAR